MISDIHVAKITGIFHRNITESILAVLKKAGIGEYHVLASRGVRLQERKGPAGLILEGRMVDHPADMVVCFVSQEQGQDVAQLMIAGGDLATPGRGSVLIEHGIIRRAHDLCAPSVLHTADSPSIDDGINLQSELTGICCIVHCCDLWSRHRRAGQAWVAANRDPRGKRDRSFSRQFLRR